MKFFHTLAACGLIGALLGYMVLLAVGPQDTPPAYANLRQSIKALCSYILLPSLAVALFTGLLSMAFHQPFQQRRWVWVKALLGLSMFEATLGVIGAKADHAAKVSIKIVEGEVPADALAKALTYEWYSLAMIMALSLASMILGVWRPALKRRKRPSTPTNGPLAASQD